MERTFLAGLALSGTCCRRLEWDRPPPRGSIAPPPPQLPSPPRRHDEDGGMGATGRGSRTHSTRLSPPGARLVGGSGVYPVMRPNRRYTAAHRPRPAPPPPPPPPPSPPAAPARHHTLWRPPVKMGTGGEGGGGAARGADDSSLSWNPSSVWMTLSHITCSRSDSCMARIWLF